jgi:DNA repair protein RadC
MKTSIKEWAAEDRPREKLERLGSRALSLSELLAILIRTGTKDKSALDIAMEINATFNLEQISKLSVKELSQIKGLGYSKAISILAAIEIGRRYITNNSIPKEKIIRPEIIAQYFMDKYGDLETEHFFVILLDNANQIIEYKAITHGLINESLVHPREVFSYAIRNLSGKIVLMHNHPSGTLQASDADKRITKILMESAKILGISILDHIIITKNGYLSFSNEGLIN